MAEHVSTLKNSGGLLQHPQDRIEKQPGVMLLFSCGKPAAAAIQFSGDELELGRGTHDMAPDPRMSRRHARVSFDGLRFWVTDLGSQNGTACDGVPLAPHQRTEVQRVIRMGDSLFGVARDVLPLAERGVILSGGKVLGPSLQQLLAEVKQATSFGDSLHITGESGTGKELLAQGFHEHGPRREGPFVPVNCAAIPQGLAERLLFGVRRGAYSSADANAEGYIQAADHGTLFLDEVGDLDLGVQAKLLRVLESKELMPLGASRPFKVDFQICSATNKDLKLQVASGRFREDLYYRIGRPMVAIPPLRRRPEEIAWLIDATVRRLTATVQVHASLVETCLLRPWPGNVRELIVEVRTAAQSAAVQSAQRVEARHLPEGAGTALRAFSDEPAPASASTSAAAPTPGLASAPAASPQPTPPALSLPTVKPLDAEEQRRLEAALRSHRGNVSGAARALGLHRTQLRRLLERYGLDPQRFSDDEKPAPRAETGIDPADR